MKEETNATANLELANFFVFYPKLSNPSIAFYRKTSHAIYLI